MWVRRAIAARLDMAGCSQPDVNSAFTRVRHRRWVTEARRGADSHLDRKVAIRLPVKGNSVPWREASPPHHLDSRGDFD